MSHRNHFLDWIKKVPFNEFNDFTSMKPIKTFKNCRMLYNYKWYRVIKFIKYTIFNLRIVCFKYYTMITMSQKILKMDLIQDNYIHIVSCTYFPLLNISNILYYIVGTIINGCSLSSSLPEFHERNNSRHSAVKFLTIPVT